MKVKVIGGPFKPFGITGEVLGSCSDKQNKLLIAISFDNPVINEFQGGQQYPAGTNFWVESSHIEWPDN